MNTLHKFNSKNTAPEINRAAWARLKEARLNLMNQTAINQAALDRRAIDHRILAVKRQELGQLESRIASQDYIRLAQVALKEQLRLAQLPFRQYPYPIGPELPPENAS